MKKRKGKPEFDHPLILKQDNQAEEVKLKQKLPPDQKFRKKFLNKLLLHVEKYGALFDLDIRGGYGLTVLVKIKKDKIILLRIQLGNQFPLDYVQIISQKFQESPGQHFTSVNQFVQKKTYYYEVNGERVKNFQDEALHTYQAVDILLFMKEIIQDINSKEGWQHNYY